LAWVMMTVSFQLAYKLPYFGKEEDDKKRLDIHYNRYK